MSIYADQGTAAHQVLEDCLKAIYDWGIPSKASDHLGRTIAITDEEHSACSPSGAKRWMTCPGSIRMQEDYPEPTPEESERTIEITQDDVFAVQVCLDYVARRVEELHGEYPGHMVQVIAERRVSPAPYLNGDTRCDGTSDITIQVSLPTGGVIFVEQVDYKHGQGVPVADDDPQLDLYLLGTLAARPAGELPKKARATVCQPRCDKVEPRTRSRDITVLGWMDPFITRVKGALHAIDTDPQQLVASVDGCRFCSARGVCETQMQFALEHSGVLGDGEHMDPAKIFDRAEAFAAQDVQTLDGAQMRAILDVREVLSGALSACEAWAIRQLQDGTASPEVVAAYKLVRGRSNRRWAGDAVITEKSLKKIKVDDQESGKRRGLGKKDLLETKLKSPTGVERVLHHFEVPTGDARWDAFNRLVEKPEGKLSLAPLADPRTAVVTQKADIEGAFDAEAMPEAPELPEATVPSP